MTIIKHVFRKFEQKETKVNIIETWLVKWDSLFWDIGNYYRPTPQIQAFTSKKDADMYAEQLKTATRCLGDHNRDITVYKQKPITNR